MGITDRENSHFNSEFFWTKYIIGQGFAMCHSGSSPISEVEMGLGILVHNGRRVSKPTDL
jgi:hypothetical protein